MVGYLCTIFFFVDFFAFCDSCKRTLLGVYLGLNACLSDTLFFLAFVLVAVSAWKFKQGYNGTESVQEANHQHPGKALSGNKHLSQWRDKRGNSWERSSLNATINKKNS